MCRGFGNMTGLCAWSYPGKGNLGSGPRRGAGDRVQHRAALARVAGRQRKPGYEPIPCPLAVDQHVSAVRERPGCSGSEPWFT